MSIPDYSKVELLLPMSGSNNGTSFIDYSQNKHKIFVTGNAKTSTAQSKYYGSSGYFDGTGDYLTIPQWINLGSNNLAIEMWIKTSATNSWCTLIQKRSASNFTSGAWAFQFNTGSANGRIITWVADYSTSGALLTASSGDVHNGAWHHVALTRNGSAWNLWLDGTSVASATWNGTIADLGQPTFIGYDTNFSGRDYGGYIQDVCITIGSAVYTGSFTPPGKMIGAISNSGTTPVTDDEGLDAVRTVVAVTRAGATAFSTQSDSDGLYSIQVPMTECDVIFEDDAAGENYSDILVSKVTPS